MSDRKDFLKELHEKALANMPEGAEHDESTCDICSASLENNPDLNGGGNVDTFTKEELEAKVAEALAPLQTKISELEAAQADSAVTAAVEEAKAEAKSELDRVQGELDTAQIEKNAAVERAEKAEKDLEETNKYFEDAFAAQEAAEQRESLKAERVEKVKEVAKFDDDELAAKADRWADMEQAAFDGLLEDYRDVAAKAAGTGTTTVPKSVIDGERETASLEGKSALGYIGEMNAAGFKPGRRI